MGAAGVGCPRVDTTSTCGENIDDIWQVLPTWFMELAVKMAVAPPTSSEAVLAIFLSSLARFRFAFDFG